MDKRCILDIEPQELEKELLSFGVPRYRLDQVVEWVYRKKADGFSRFSNLPLDLRRGLEQRYTLRSLALHAKDLSRLDGTIRFRFRTRDGLVIPAVFLPKKDRNTVCLSSQAGCAVGCRFCASGKVKFKRNLTRGEILEQIIAVEQDTGRRITGVLFMGMGEPLMNYANVLSALKAIVDFRELGLGRRHVTVSTVGLVPAIRKLADEHPGVRLALSLHAPDDATRRRFIPEKVPYLVKEILEAGLYYSRRNSVPLTIEYILVPGVNDTLLLAQKLVKLIQKSSKPTDQVQVNLIPCNVTATSKWEEPAPEAVQKFRDCLADNGIVAVVREARGADIGAACGQLGV